MNKIQFWIGIVFTLLMMDVLYAGSQPKFTIIPRTSNSITVKDTEISTVIYTVTNRTKITRNLIMVPLGSGITQDTTSPGSCKTTFTLYENQSCALTLKVSGSQLALGLTEKTIEVCKTNSTSETPDPFLCSQTSQQDRLSINVVSGVPQITVNTHNLILTTNGAPVALTVTNLSPSVTATNVKAHLIGTVLDGNVTQNFSQCVKIAPKASCQLIFTPGSTAVSTTTVAVYGDNTTQVPVNITISSTSSANLNISASPLILTVGGGTGIITVTNLSPTITATNIAAELTPITNAALSQNASACTTLAPLASCNLVFTPVATLQSTSIPIYGTNASITSATIAVDASPGNTLQITSGSPMILAADGVSTGEMVIYNSSTTNYAHNVNAYFANTALSGAVTATSCGDIAPLASCTMTFTAGSVPVNETSFPIYGSDTSTISGTLGLSSYLVYIANFGSNSVSSCRINLTTGDLYGCTTVFTSTGNLTAVAASSDGTTLYIANSYSNATGALPPGITACKITPSTGALSCSSQTSLANFTTNGGNIYGLAYLPSLNLVYITWSQLATSSGVIQCTTSNGNIGTCSNAGATGTVIPQGIAINPAGTYAYIANFDNTTITQCSIQTSGGNLSCNNDLSIASSNNIGVTINSSDTSIYVANSSGQSVTQCTIDSSTTPPSLTGCSTPTVVSTSNISGLSLSGALGIIYVGTLTDSGVVRKCTIDSISGNITTCTSSGASGLSNPDGMALYPATS